MSQKVVSKCLSVIMSLFILFSLAACQKSEDAGAAGKSASTSGRTSMEQSTQRESSVAADPFGKYESPITLSCVRSTAADFNIAQGEAIDGENIWADIYEDELNIKLQYDWIVDDGQYGEKLNVSIASNKLPDIFILQDINNGPYKQLDMLVKSGSIADLTEIYNQYASPLVKNIMDQDVTQIKSTTINGKLMGIPHTTSSVDKCNILWIRPDWLKNVGMEEPKTLNDVLKVAEAFTTKDPDRNGKPDTIGLGVEKKFFNAEWGTLEPLAYAYHSYPNRWIDDGTGKLVYGSIMPGIKQALQVAQDMYKKGQIDKEFGIKDDTKLAETVTSGKCGMFFGLMWNPLFPLRDQVENDPGVDWKCLPIVSADESPVKNPLSNPVKSIFVVNKNCKNPEALIKMINIFALYNYDKKAFDFDEMSKKRYGEGTPEKQSCWKFAFAVIEPPKKNVNAYIAVSDAFKSNDTSKLDAEQKYYYDQIVSFKGGDMKGWGINKVFGDNGSFDLIQHVYIQNESFEYNRFYGAPTPTMVSKNAALKKMEDETFMGIIMGNASIDEFDKFVAKWKAIGGDQITKEVNEWYAAHK